MSPDEAQMDAALQQKAREEAAALLSQVLEEGRRDAADIIRARFTAALVKEVEQLVLPGSSDAGPAPAVAEPARSDQKQAAVPAEPLAGWYVYGLTWDGPARALDVAAGVEDAPVEVVAAGPIAAVVSPMATTEQWGVRGDGEVDLELLAPRARRHEWVLEQMLERGAVLPLRFGVLYPSLDPLRQMLRDRRAAFEEALRRLENRFEWGLTISVEEADAPRPLSAVPGASTGGGRDYLAQRRADRLAEEERAGDSARLVTDLHETLMGLSADSRIHPAAAGRGRGKVVLRASYLVPASNSEAFRTAAERELAAAAPQLRLTGELTGPWPAYHFCDLAIDGVTA